MHYGIVEWMEWVVSSCLNWRPLKYLKNKVTGNVTPVNYDSHNSLLRLWQVSRYLLHWLMFTVLWFACSPAQGVWKHGGDSSTPFVSLWYRWELFSQQLTLQMSAASIMSRMAVDFVVCWRLIISTPARALLVQLSLAVSNLKLKISAGTLIRCNVTHGRR